MRGNEKIRERLSAKSDTNQQLKGWMGKFSAILLIGLSTETSFAEQIASFESPAAMNDWAVVNDTVMGGISKGTFTRTPEGTLLFSGQLSLENNGGFASIRNRPRPLNLARSSSIELRVKGDGRTYYLDLRSASQRMGGSFRAQLPTLENKWQTLTIPISDFKFQSFGRARPSVRMNPSTISSIGFTLSDKNPGVFELEIDYVKSLDETPLIYKSDASESERQLSLIELTISKGVPLFNMGEVGACADIYEVACTALLSTQKIPDAAIATIQQALEEAKTTDTQRGKAWILRYALDEVRGIIETNQKLD